MRRVGLGMLQTVFHVKPRGLLQLDFPYYYKMLTRITIVFDVIYIGKIVLIDQIIYIHLISMQKQILIAITVAIAALLLVSIQPKDQTPSELFQKWRVEHGLMLDLPADKLAYRERIFMKNVQEIEEHNSKTDQTYLKGINQFTAYTQQEFESMFLSKIEPLRIGDAPQKQAKKISINIDWVSYGAVSPVRNQGACIASYAFASIGGIEGVNYIKYRSQIEFSEQQLVDCSISYGNNGCSYGNMVSSYNYILDKGINTASYYPYRGNFGACHTSTGSFHIQNYTSLTSCFDMDNALIGRPIPVAVDAQNFNSYRSGIFSNCGRYLSLAALLVGATDQYYRLKNSWGTGWGEGGYIRLAKFDNVCGICDAATYPNI